MRLVLIAAKHFFAMGVLPNKSGHKFVLKQILRLSCCQFLPRSKAKQFSSGLVAKQFLPWACCQTIFATGVLPNNFPHERLASFPHWRVAKQISPRADGTERLYRSLQHVQLNPVQLIFPVHLHTGQTHKTCVNISVRVCTTYAKSATV